MGKPKKCDFRPGPFIDYITTTTSTTTLPPEDFSNYISIPSSGAVCPTTTTTTTTSTTTTLPPSDPNFPCVSYSFLPSDLNGAVITFAPCNNNNSLNQVVVGSIQRLDFCAEKSSPIKILSGNGSLVYNGGCSQFENDIKTTTTTTTTNNPLKLEQPKQVSLILLSQQPSFRMYALRINAPDSWFSLRNQGIPIYLLIDSVFSSSIDTLNDFTYLVTVQYTEDDIYYTRYFANDPTDPLWGNYFQYRVLATSNSYLPSDYTYSNYQYNG